jgi:hypothetical protein
MVMLLQALAAVLLLLGSGLIFHALLALEREPRREARQMARPASGDRDLPRAA